jgi:hypothetical protein
VSRGANVVAKSQKMPFLDPTQLECNPGNGPLAQKNASGHLGQITLTIHHIKQ